jgi:hypothetical protein
MKEGGQSACEPSEGSALFGLSSQKAERFCSMRRHAFVVIFAPCFLVSHDMFSSFALRRQPPISMSWMCAVP